MRVRCILCEKIDTLNDESLFAKRLRNRPIHTYMCETCYARIERKTKERLATGKFRFYRSSKHETEW